MRTSLPLILAIATVPIAMASAQGPKSAMPMVTAALADETGAGKGTATFMQHGKDLHVMVRATGLTPGIHGVHLHTTGKCEAPGFTSAGGHWNPTSMKHGKKNPMGPHEGDLPNMTAMADGTGKLDATIKGATIPAMMDADGTAIVVHAGPDDYKTDPAGNSGGRVACGVVTAS